MSYDSRYLFPQADGAGFHTQGRRVFQDQELYIQAEGVEKPEHVQEPGEQPAGQGQKDQQKQGRGRAQTPGSHFAP